MIRNFWLALLFTPLLSACGLVEIKDRLLDQGVAMIPMDFEEGLGDQLLPSILPPSEEIRDPALRADLEQLLEPLTKQINSPRIKIHISRDPTLNAFAIPGGHLIFNQGMLAAATSPEEILGVAAHEMAHASERHVLRSSIQNLGIFAIVTVFLGDFSGIAALLIQEGQTLLAQGFSRNQETAADTKGFDYLVRAGVNPQGMVSFFERLQSQPGRSETPLGEFYSTHPLTSSRIEAIEGRLKSLSESERRALQPSSFDLKGFQSRLPAAAAVGSEP